MFNRVILIGNVGKDPEIKSMNNGGKVATFSIATSERWRDKATGEKKERTEWHNIVVFNEGIVGVIEQFVKKGTRVGIEGSLATRKWQHSDGTDRYSTEVVLKQFNGSLILMGENTGGGRPAPDEDAYGSTRTKEGRKAAMDDEIPF